MYIYHGVTDYCRVYTLYIYIYTYINKYLGIYLLPKRTTVIYVRQYYEL